LWDKIKNLDGIKNFMLSDVINGKDQQRSSWILFNDADSCSKAYKELRNESIRTQDKLYVSFTKIKNIITKNSLKFDKKLIHEYKKMLKDLIIKFDNEKNLDTY